MTECTGSALGLFC